MPNLNYGTHAAQLNGGTLEAALTAGSWFVLKTGVDGAFALETGGDMYIFARAGNVYSKWGAVTNYVGEEIITEAEYATAAGNPAIVTIGGVLLSSGWSPEFAGEGIFRLFSGVVQRSHPAGSLDVFPAGIAQGVVSDAFLSMISGQGYVYAFVGGQAYRTRTGFWMPDISPVSLADYLSQRSASGSIVLEGGSSPSAPLYPAPAGTIYQASDTPVIKQAAGIDLRDGNYPLLARWATMDAQVVVFEQLMHYVGNLNTAIQARVLQTSLDADNAALGYIKDTDLAQAIANLNINGTRLGGIPVYTYFEGTAAALLAAIDDSNSPIKPTISSVDDFDNELAIGSSVILLKDGAAYNLVQYRAATGGNRLEDLNLEFMTEGGALGTEIRPLTGSLAGRAFVTLIADNATGTLDLVLSTSNYDYTAADGSLLVDPIARTLTVRINPDHLEVGASGIQVKQSLIDQINKIPGMETAIGNLQTLTQNLNNTISNLVNVVLPALASRVEGVEAAIAILDNFKTQVTQKFADGFAQSLSVLFVTSNGAIAEVKSKIGSGGWATAPTSIAALLGSAGGNHSRYAVNHDRGVEVPHSYWEATAAGAKLSEIAIKDISGSTDMSMSITVPHNKTTMLFIPAGVRSGVFSAFS